MPDSWAITGVDLHVEIGGHHRRDGLERALREAIQSGRLLPGTRLPSSRSLAADLGTARNTVADAFTQLVAEGWLVARTGAGTYVSDRSITAQITAPRRVPAAPLPYDLRPGRPDLSAFPRGAWSAAARRALSSAPTDALGYGDPQGQEELRVALAGYLARTRGVLTSPDRIVVCVGFMQGLALLSTVLRSSGPATIVTEAFGHPAYRHACESRGMRVRTTAVDVAGAVLDPVGPLKDADALLLTPAHQFPLGATLSAPRRREAVRWAIEHSAIVIEDDYDGEFRYDRQPIGAVQPLAPEHVVFAGTASKTLAPGLRLGWLALPERLVGPVVAARLLADHAGNVLSQLTMAEFITSGGYDRHVRRSRLRYRRRRERLVRSLRATLPAARIVGDAAGLHLVLQLPAGSTEEAVVSAAADRGLALEAVGAYSTGAPYPPAIVLGFAAPPDHAFAGATSRLLAALVAAHAADR